MKSMIWVSIEPEDIPWTTAKYYAKAAVKLLGRGIKKEKISIPYPTEWKGLNMDGVKEEEPPMNI